jgi:hypothetical protein
MKVYLNIILALLLGLASGLLYFFHQNSECIFLVSPIHASCPAHLILLNLINYSIW